MAIKDAFVAKLSRAGEALLYSTYLGGSSDDQGNSIAVNLCGQAYVAGFTDSTDFPIHNALQTTLNGYLDAFVTKLSRTGGALVYSTYLGGSDHDGGSGIAVDLLGQAYVIGYTSSTDFPIRNALQPIFGGDYNDVFVAKLSSQRRHSCHANADRDDDDEGDDDRNDDDNWDGDEDDDDDDRDDGDDD